MEDPKLKLCVKITGVLLKNSPTQRRTPLPFALSTSGSEGFKDIPYAEAQRKRCLARLAQEDPDCAIQKQFRIIVPVAISIREMKALIVRQFGKLYPEEDPISVLYLREDGLDCDLDDDFLVADFFAQNAFVLAICRSAAAGGSSVPAASCVQEPVCELAMPRPFITTLGTIDGVLQSAFCPTPEPTPAPPELKEPEPEPKQAPRRTKRSKKRDGPAKKPAECETSRTIPEASNKVATMETPPRLERVESKPAHVPGPGEAKIELVDKQLSRCTDSQKAHLPPVPIDAIQGQPATVVPSRPASPSKTPAQKVDMSTIAKMIQADTAESGSDSSSSDDDDSDCAIPVVGSSSLSTIKVLSAPSSSSDESDVGAGETLLAHRTSLTLLTEELRKSNTASPVLSAGLVAAAVGRPRRRRNRKKDSPESPHPANKV